MHCTACVMNIEGELEDTEGVKCASTSYAKQTSEVEFDPKILTEGKILGIIESLGYKAAVQK